MKGLLLGMFMTIGMAIGHAGADDVGDGCANCGHGIRGTAASSVPSEGFAEIGLNLPDPNVDQVKGKLCGDIIGNGNTVADKFIGSLDHHLMKYYGLTSPTVAHRVAYLNTNKTGLTCPTLDNKNYMTVAAERGVQQELFQELFFRRFYKKDKKAKIEINIVYKDENGIPVTVLDTLKSEYDKAVANEHTATAKQLNMTIKMFKKIFGAKFYADLTVDEKKILY